MIIWIGLAGNDDGRVVLLGAVEFVGKLIIDPDAVDFSSRLIHLRGPRASTVERDISAAVV